MEGKTVILCVLIITLVVMAQVQVEATVCCPSKSARRSYDVCTIGSTQVGICIAISGCRYVVPESSCPGGFLDHDILENSGDAVTEYCKLGCASTVCGPLTTLQNSDANEIVNGAVEECTKACSTFCTKGSMAAVGRTA